MQKFFKQGFVYVMLFWMFVLSLRLLIENAIDVDGDSLEVLLKIFLTFSDRLDY